MRKTVDIFYQIGCRSHNLRHDPGLFRAARARYSTKVPDNGNMPSRRFVTVIFPGHVALPRGHYAPPTSNVISLYAINALNTNESIQIAHYHPVSKPCRRDRNKNQDIKIHSMTRCYFLYIRRHVVTLPRDAQGF